MCRKYNYANSFNVMQRSRNNNDRFRKVCFIYYSISHVNSALRLFLVSAHPVFPLFIVISYYWSYIFKYYVSISISIIVRTALELILGFLVIITIYTYLESRSFSWFTTNEVNNVRPVTTAIHNDEYIFIHILLT